MKFRKLSALFLSVMMLVSTTGCEQAQVANYDINQNAENLTDEEKQKLAEYFEQAANQLREGEVPSGLLTDTEGTGQPEAKTEEGKEPETKTEEKADPLKKEKENAAKEAEFYKLDETGHANVTLEEILAHYRGVDETALDGIIAEMDQYDQENKNDPEPEKTVTELYKLLDDMYAYEDAQETMSGVIYNLDTTVTENGDKAAADSTKLTLLSNKAKMAVKRVLEGPYADALKEVIDAHKVEKFLATKELSDRGRELEEANDKLVVEYKAVLNESLTVTYEGIDYSFEDISDEKIEATIRNTVETMLQKELAAKVYPIYHQLIVNRNELAKEYGYENYAEYAYKEVYGRDYTTGEIKALADEMFNMISGLMISSLFLRGDASLAAFTYTESNEAMLETLKNQITTVVPELEESISYLIDNKLYTFGSEKVRAPGAFMAPMRPLRSGFVYVTRTETGNDYETITHEFGHFNNAYRVSESPLALTQHLDILEVHSQGLELLGSSTLSNVFPDAKGDFSANTVFDMTQNITSALMVAAFEIACYEKPDMTLEEMNMEFGKYMMICMTGGNAEAAPESGIWAEIHHIFESPLYYSAYAISALSALDIYAGYLDNPEEGVKRYVDLSNIDPNLPYKEAVNKVGLRDMTQKENISAVIDTITQKFNDKMFSGDGNVLETIGQLFGMLLLDYLEKEK